MRRAVMTLAAAATFGAGVLVVTPAMADDGRAVGANAEVRSVLRHTMGRNPDGSQPDRHTVPHYLAGVKNLGCQWGVLDATYRMAVSPEAQRRWNHNAQDLAGMLYAGLLNRAPDPGGLQAYTTAIRTHGLPWSTGQMLGSAEYRLRLARICGTSAPKLRASLYDWQSANRFARDVLLHNALNLAKLCGSQKAIQKVISYRENATGPRAFIGITGEVTKVLHGKLDGTCRAMITYVEAAAAISWHVVNGGDGHNPVFIQYDTHKSWVSLNMVTYFSVRVGTDPTNWHAYQGKTSAG